MARNVTVLLEEEVAIWAKLEAARRDTSISRLVAGLLKESYPAPLTLTELESSSATGVAPADLERHFPAKSR